VSGSAEPTRPPAVRDGTGRPVLRLTLDPGVRRGGAGPAGGGPGGTGRVLWQARPFRCARLSAEQGRTVDRWAAGEPVGGSAADQRLARRLLDAGFAHPVWSETPARPAGVTVVIPVRDRTPLLSRLIAAIGDVADVVIVDDGSRVPVDGALVRHERPRGPAAARNAGWQRAATELVAFVDSDCLPRPGWLEALLPHFADPQVAAVAPRIVSAPGSSLLARYEGTRAPHDLGPKPGAVRPRAPVSYVSATVLVVRRAVLAELGGFSEKLRFGEDLDLVYRMAAAGLMVRYEPAAVAEHQPRTRPGPWLAQRFSYGSTDAPLLRRHPASMAPVTASPWSAAAWALAAGRRFGPAAAVAAGSAALTFVQAREVTGGRTALRLGARGHLRAGHDLASALLRPWWPVTAAAAAVSPAVRRGVAAVALACYASEWRERRPELGLAAWCGLRLLDDVSYGTGIWAGCVRHRTVRPLVPDLHGRPGLGRRL
jgi:mycofactocin glycosyltransferase